MNLNSLNTKNANGRVEWDGFDNQITLFVSCKVLYFVL